MSEPDSSELPTQALPPSPGPTAPMENTDDVPTTAYYRPVPQAKKSPAPPPVVPGYEILGELGRGGMGVVYKARQATLNRIVALKMILSGSHAGEDELKRFQTEAEAVAQLQHPNFIQIYEIGEVEGRHYCVLEFAEGGSLASKLTGAPLPPHKAAGLVHTLALAMDLAHQNHIVHRDLKPGNILLKAIDSRSQSPESTFSIELGSKSVPGSAKPSQGTSLSAGPSAETWSLSTSFIPKITDFGLAKRLHTDHGQTQTGAILGTPSYMAPEQADPRLSAIGPAADIYALGAILYELLTGRPPFKGETPMETILQVTDRDPVPPRMLNPRVDRDLETIALKCLEKSPERRYPSAAELAEDLRRYTSGESILARSVNVLERIQRELSYSQHDLHLRPWGKGLMWLALLIFAAHLLTSLLLLAEAPPFLSYWIPRTLMLISVVPLLLKFRPHAAIWPANAAERSIWAIWVGYMLAFLSTFLVMQVQHHDHLEIYGAVTALSGMAWYAMGGAVWGGCFLIGGAFLAMAPVMAMMAGSVWSSFCFGTLWSLALLTLGLRYWRLGQE